MANPRVLILFDYDWDSVGFNAHRDRVQFEALGFDLFSFPNNARLLHFSIRKFIANLKSLYTGDFSGQALSAVVSNNEQFGTLAAALLAESLGLPGTAPGAIVKLQHKYYCRQLIEQVAPEANLRQTLLPSQQSKLAEAGLTFPLFTKPIKAAFSVLAREVKDLPALQRHLSFGWFEEIIIRRLIKPFDDVAFDYLPEKVGAWNMVAEEVYRAAQYNLDGYVVDGEAHLLGVVDEIMYPGTQAFMRFAYPSRLAGSVQQRALEVARKVLAAAGFRHGMFNMEFFYCEDRDELKVIEFNPRLASQLADIYRKVDGVDVYGINLALALGEDPALVPRLPPLGTHAASFVFRCFDEQVPPPPRSGGKAWLRVSEPEAILMSFIKSKAGLKRELKWLGSHRYGTLNLHGTSDTDLRERYAAACNALGWPSPY
jgi:ATP-grasp domain